MARRLPPGAGHADPAVVSAEAGRGRGPRQRGVLRRAARSRAVLAMLGIGVVTYRIGRDELTWRSSGGFAEVRNDKVIILADTGRDAGRHRPRPGRAGARAGRGAPDWPQTQEEIATSCGAALVRALDPAAGRRPRPVSVDIRGPGGRPNRSLGQRSEPPRRQHEDPEPTTCPRPDRRRHRRGSAYPAPPGPERIAYPANWKDHVRIRSSIARRQAVPRALRQHASGGRRDEGGQALPTARC